MKFQIIQKNLKLVNKIIFSDCYYEWGWTLSKFSGYIRKYKLDNPKKKILIHTCKENKALYYDLFDENDFIYYKIPDNGYSNCYDFSDDTFIKNEIKNLQKKYSNYFIYNLRRSRCDKQVFSGCDFDYNFSNNEDIIDFACSLINEKNYICVFPRYRKTGNTRIDGRNYPYWQELFEIIGDKYNIINCTPNIKYNNIINFQHNNFLAVVIELLNYCDFCISSQSSGTILSNIMKRENIFIGDDIERCEILENPFKIKCLGIYSQNYNLSPEEFAKQIIKFEKEINT